MKTKIFLILALAITVLTSCNNDVEEGLYCVKMIKKTPESTTLSKSEINEIKNLFTRNNFDYTKYLFTRFQKDEIGFQHVGCYQFVNGLIVFTNDVIFHFKEGNYQSLSGNLVSEIDLNTKPFMEQDNVVEMFINRIKQDEQLKAFSEMYEEFAKIDETIKVIHIEDIINGCFDIEYGYYDLNAGISYADEKYVKAWRINSKVREKTLAYIDDEKSELIYYSNGIIVN